MNRTEFREEVKRMRFEEAYGGWIRRKLTQEQAALLLGVSVRTFRRYISRYEEEGLEGSFDRIRKGVEPIHGVKMGMKKMSSAGKSVWRPYVGP